MKINIISESAFGIVGHGVHTAYLEHLASLKGHAGVEVVTNSKESADIVHLHTVGTYAFRRLFMSTGKNVVSAHVIPESFVGSLIGARFWAPYAKVYLRWFYNRADAVVAVSEDTKHHLLAMGVKKPVTVIENTIDTSRYRNTAELKKQARKKLDIGKDAWVVVGAGQVQPRKRIDTFIETALALPDVQFIWVGGMPFGKMAAEHGAMEQLMALASPNVTFTGIIPFEQMCEYYKAADAFFLPSAQETFGLVVVEAAAAGLPVVVRDIPDYSETFKGDVVMGDDETFADELRKLRDDKAHYTKMKTASERIAKRYDSKMGAEVLLKLYRTLLNKE